MEDAEVSMDCIDCEKAKVEAEVWLGQITREKVTRSCVLDLLITLEGKATELPARFHVLIEQKIKSPESDSYGV